MGDGDNVSQVKQEEVGDVELGGGRTHIYMGDEDGVSKFKKEGEGVSHSGGRTHVNIGESHLARRARGFADLILKTSDGWFCGSGLKTISSGFDQFRPQNLEVMDRWTHGGISKLASRQSKVDIG